MINKLGPNTRYELSDDIVLSSKKLHWYYAPVFAAFWTILYLAVVHPQVTNLPTAITTQDELDNNHADSFISERAEHVLINLTSIGPKALGSYENEMTTVEFLRTEIAKVQNEAHSNFEIEIDHQVATGNFTQSSMLRMYQNLQNIIVRVQNKGVTNENYLLINSHFDTVPGSPGAGDAGSMVAVMLEVMRVITKSAVIYEHAIIFLFNGAEEPGLLASHGFITQHKWAKNCKALINLDAAGNSGREILFQSGPDNGWLMGYYLNVPHPFASTIGEEMFQAGLIPSDTDFRIFRDYGSVPGLDMAYITNGFVYHTQYDRMSLVLRASLQHTGDNVLSLARGLANAPELNDPSSYENGHIVFFDYLGWFLVAYTEVTGIIINSVVSFVALVAIAISVYCMTRNSVLEGKPMFLRCLTTLLVQIISIALAIGLTLFVAFFMDAVNRSMSWFSQSWLIFGLYFSPMFFGLTVLPARYLERHKNRGLTLNYGVQLFMHAHCFFLIICTVVLTAMGIRTSFMLMMAVFFDMCALIINLATRWHRKPYHFAAVIIICQIFPFWYFAYNAEATYDTLIPMLARGSLTNPEIQVAAIAILTSLLLAGFILPLFMFFRKTRALVWTFAGICLIYIILGVTNIGFPFQAQTAPQRMDMVHAQRVLYDANGNVRTNDTGILVRTYDRRTNSSEEYLEGMDDTFWLSEVCGDEMYCGFPLISTGWYSNRQYVYWIPLEEPPTYPSAKPKLELLSITDLDSPRKKRFTFSVSGPDRMGIYLRPEGEATITDWSFDASMLTNRKPPYFIYYTYGLKGDALNFTVDVEKSATESLSMPTLEIGIAGHWVHESTTKSTAFQNYISSFPEYVYMNEWVSSYESWIF